MRLPIESVYVVVVESMIFHSESSELELITSFRNDKGSKNVINIGRPAILAFGSFLFNFTPTFLDILDTT